MPFSCRPRISTMPFAFVAMMSLTTLMASERIEVVSGVEQQITIPIQAGVARDLVLEAARPSIRQAVALPAGAHTVAEVGDHLLIGSGDRLLVYAATRPLAERPLAALKLPLANRFMVTTAAHAFVVGAHGLAVVDVGDMQRPRLLAELELEPAVAAIALDEGRLYLASSSGRLIVIDVSLPDRPKRIAEADLGVAVHGLAAIDGRLYIAAGESGLRIYDSRRPAAIAALGGYRTTGPVLDLTVVDGLAYLACGPQGVTILDVHDVQQIRWLGSHQQVGDVQRLRWRDGRLYTLGSGRRFGVLDVGHPEMPSIVGATRLESAGVDLLPAVDGVYLLATDALAIVDVSVTTPEISNEGLDFGQGVNLGGQRRGVIRDGLLYVADWFSGIHVYDISSRDRPRLLASLHTPGSPKGIVLDGDYAYVADDDHGLEVIDIREPAAPRLVARLQTPGLAYTPVVVGQRLYLASHRGGFQIIDIGDPFAPRLVSETDTPGKAWSIAVRDDLAYVADDDNGLLVFDISNEQRPRQITRYSPGGAVEDVLLDGSTAYLALFEGGLHVLDISHPETPRRIARLDLPGNTRGLERQGRTLYVAGWLAGLHTIDISDPQEPRLLASYDTPGAAWGVRVDTGRAYVFDWWGGLGVLDVSEPGRPRGLARYPDADGRVEAIATQGDYAFVAHGRAGLQVFDIRNPLNPTWVTGVEIMDARRVVVGDGLAYVLAGRRELHVVDVADPFVSHERSHLALEGEVEDMVALHGRLYLLGGQGHLAAFDPDQGRIVPVAGTDGLIDLWSDGGRLVATTRDGEVRVYDVSEPDAPVVARRYSVAEGVSQARLLGGRAFVYETGVGYEPLVRQPGKSTLPLLALTDRVRDIQGGGQAMLYALTEEGTVIGIDAGAAHWRPVTIYRPLVPATAMTLHRGVLYLAGARQIVAIRALDALRITPGTGGIELSLPAAMPLGDYRLVSMAAPVASGGRLLHVKRRPYSKHRLSPEALRRLVAERRRQAAAKASPDH